MKWISVWEELQKLETKHLKFKFRNNNRHKILKLDVRNFFIKD